MHDPAGAAQGQGGSIALSRLSYPVVIFDFDGTLADSFPFVLGVFNQVARKHGLNTVSPTDIDGLRRGSTASILKHLGLPRWRVPFITREFMALMRSPEAHIPLFEGIPEALHALHGAGVRLGVVSSNAPDNVTRILGPELMGLVSHLDGGVSMFGKGSRIKKAVRVLSGAGQPQGRAIYVGDQLADHEAASRAGVDFGAVSWGYADVGTLMRAQPQEVFDSVRALWRLAT
jgi:phosphoglycolate phosphatase